MNSTTVKKLNLLNQNFYSTIGEYFNHSRNYAWEGWDKLLENIQNNTKESSPDILDLGCGNARFLEFLLAQKIILNSYTGLDNSELLLEKAREKLVDVDHNLFKLEKVDLLFENWISKISQRFSLITIFGVMHHVPSLELRLELLSNAKKMLNKNGFIVFTTWNYLDIERLKKRIVDLDSMVGQNLLNDIDLKKNDLEPGDNILDWVKGKLAYRYSHYYTDIEVMEILEKTGLKLITKFVADGRESNVNTYYTVK